jgi:hypothetical protein
VFGVHSVILNGPLTTRLAGLIQSSPCFSDRVLGQTEAGVVGEHLDEVAGRALELHLQRLRVDRPHAELLEALQLAGVDRLGVLDRVEDRGVLGRLLRVEHAAEAVDEVLGRDRRAVGPGVVADLEGVGEAVVADLPALGGTRDGARVGGVGGEAHEQVADDDVLPGAGDAVRVEALGLAHGGGAVDHFGGPGGVARGEAQAGDQRQRARRGPQQQCHPDQPSRCRAGASSEPRAVAPA